LASAATTSIPSGEYLVTATSGSTVSVGYWYRTVGAVPNISTLLVPDSDYAAFQAGDSFHYYPTYSVVNTALAALSTHVITDVTAPLHLVIVGVDFAATTVFGLEDVFNAACEASPSCANGGLCNSVTSPGCDCAPNGWGGATCSTPICSAVTCSAHQVCSAPDTCTCASGWSGSSCSEVSCTPACVSGQGTCTGPNTCTCASGWSGPTCSQMASSSPSQVASSSSGVALYVLIPAIVGGALIWVAIGVLVCFCCRRRRRVLEALRAKSVSQQRGVGIAEVQLQGMPTQTHGQVPARYMQHV